MATCVFFEHSKQTNELEDFSMKNMTGLKALIAYAIVLYAVVLLNYTSQAHDGDSKTSKLFPLQSGGCSSSSSSGGAE